MLRLLASRLLKKRLLAAWKAARKGGKMNVESQKRRQSPKRSCLPTAATLPSAMNGDFGTSPPNGGRPSDESATYLSPTGMANSKDCCHLSYAAAPLPRFTMFLAGTAARPCAATSRRDVPRSWRPRSPLADLGHILIC